MIIACAWVLSSYAAHVRIVVVARLASTSLCLLTLGPDGTLLPYATQPLLAIPAPANSLTVVTHNTTHAAVLINGSHSGRLSRDSDAALFGPQSGTSAVTTTLWVTAAHPGAAPLACFVFNAGTGCFESNPLPAELLATATATATSADVAPAAVAVASAAACSGPQGGKSLSAKSTDAAASDVWFQHMAGAQAWLKFSLRIEDLKKRHQSQRARAANAAAGGIDTTRAGAAEDESSEEEDALDEGPYEDEDVDEDAE